MDNGKATPTPNVRPEIRQYLVLLQDSLAIKFVPIQDRQDRDGINYNRGGGDAGKNSSTAKNRIITTEFAPNPPSSESSLQGIFLFKEFVQANASCIWNPEVTHAITSLEYKGTILPSTILVGGLTNTNDDDDDDATNTIKGDNANNNNCVNMVKLAWARKILKSPPGFRIEFVGEIEELLADPVEPSHFIPLSDSICWAIHELTGAGREAFVDGILEELETSFPGTVLPPKELLYQVLERLTKSKKVYQTENGYFITGGEGRKQDDSDGDEIYRKADNNNPKSAITSSSSKSSLRRCSSLRNSIKKYERVTTGCLPRRTFSLRGRSKGKNNKGTAAVVVGKVQKGDKSGDVVVTSDKELTSSKESLVLDRRRKHKSFLKNLLTFRRSSGTSTSASSSSSSGKGWKSNKNGKKGNKAITTKDAEDKLQLSTTKEISTQTSNSLENLGESLRLLSVSTSGSGHDESNSSSSMGGPQTPSPTLGKGQFREQDSDSGRYTESSTPSEYGKDHHATTSNPSSSAIPPSCASTTSTSKDEEDLELGRLLSPTPTPSSSSSAAYLYNNPYRRRYLGYQHHTPLLSHSPNGKSFTLPLASHAPSVLSNTTSSSCFKYPARPWEKRAIYERLQHSAKITASPAGRKFMPGGVSSPPPPLLNATPKPVTIFTTTTNQPTSTSTSSNVQVELLLPLGKLINQVLTDFDDANNKPKTGTENETTNSDEATPTPNSNPQQSKNNMFTFKSSVSSNTSTPMCRSEVEVDVQFTAGRDPSQWGLFFQRGKVPQSKSGRSSSSNNNSCSDGVERVSFKPLVGLGECRESEII